MILDKSGSEFPETVVACAMAPPHLQPVGVGAGGSPQLIHTISLGAHNSGVRAYPSSSGRKLRPRDGK